MKPKKIEKKLALNKKTIADLNNGQLGIIKGGYLSIPQYTCPQFSKCACKLTEYIPCDTLLETCTCPRVC